MSTSPANYLESTLTSEMLANKLSDPATAASLSSLIDRAGLLAFLLQGVDELLARSDVIADSLAEGLDEVRAATADAGRNGAVRISEVTSNFGRLLVALSQSAPAITGLLDSGMFRGDVMRLLSDAADAAVEARRAADSSVPKVHGAYSLVKSLKDPDVQKGVSYIIELAGALGKRI